MTQEQLNDCIAEELNKWQTILEYGRIYLDEDKAVRDKYKWLIYLKNSLPWGLLLTFADGIASCFCDETILLIMFPILVIFSLIALFVFYKKRNTFSKLVDDKEKNKLENLLDLTNKYLAKLTHWLINVDSHIKLTYRNVNDIEKEFIVAKTIQLPNDNEFSCIFGNLNPIWVTRAKDVANERLQPLKYYIYE
jgi:hypothetical protein